MTKDTCALLETAGWSPNYRSDLDLYKKAYEKEGFDFPIVVQRVLSQFGGLIIKYNNDVLEFCVEHAVVGIGRCRDLSFFKIIGSKVYPIGSCIQGLCLLFVCGESGYIYGLHDNGCNLIGRDIDEAICNILAGKVTI
jgi:hypothetical protein